ncbi:OprD family outer membrane porin, partial [Marinobacter alexandrii]|uniref:OprD family outer membrane porin n=1 Tax=Marinobacter alexandrii TaxID=2570351 RepID=UPI0032985AF3
DIVSALGYAFANPKEQPWYLLDDLKEALEDTHPFISDSTLAFDLRTFSFDRKNAVLSDGDALAVGGQLRYGSGNWNGLSVEAAWYNSTEVDASGTPTGLLTLNNENINVLGEANLSYQFSDGVLEGGELKLYRQKLNLPYLNTQDSRMLPSTHEGYMLQGKSSEVDYVVGHITQFKQRSDDQFRYLSEVAGAQGTDEGLTLIGAQIPLTEHLTVGAITQYGWDTFNTFYSESSYSNKFSENLDFQLSGQYTNQRSVGDEIVGSFDTWHAAAQAALRWRGAMVRLAGSRTGDGARIRAPWGGKPGYLSIQRSDFDAANERAVMLGFSYNTEYFSSLGLSSFVNIARGRDGRIAAEGVDLPDRTEYNLTVDYKPPGGALRGLWLRLRWAHLDVERDGKTVRDIRLIVNYTLPLI